MLQSTDYLALAACLLLSGLLCAGVLSGRRWANALAYSCAAAVFAVHVLGARLDYIWPWLWPHPSVLILSLAAVWGPLVAVLLGLARYLPRAGDRRALHVIALLVGAFGVYSAVRPLFPAPVNGRSYWQGEVLIQSTASTCIAAASATYLRTLGLEIDEAAAASAGLISSEGGDQLSAWRILRLKLGPQYRVRIAPLSRAQAAAQQGWLLTAARYDFALGHELVIRPLPTGDLLIRDPVDGEYIQSWAEFEPRWLKVCVWAEKR